MGEPKPVMIDAKLVDEAEALGLDVKQLAEDELARRIEAERIAKQWAEENKAFVESYNRRIEKDGVAGEEWRRYG